MKAGIVKVEIDEVVAVRYESEAYPPEPCSLKNISVHFQQNFMMSPALFAAPEYPVRISFRFPMDRVMSIDSFYCTLNPASCIYILLLYYYCSIILYSPTQMECQAKLLNFHRKRSAPLPLPAQKSAVSASSARLPVVRRAGDAGNNSRLVRFLSCRRAAK